MPPSMVYKSPMVFTFKPNPHTSATPTISDTREPGMRARAVIAACDESRSSRGHRNRMARQTTPTAQACQFTVVMLSAVASLSMVSTVDAPAENVSPRKSFICPMTSVTAMPAVKPVVMVWERSG